MSRDRRYYTRYDVDANAMVYFDNFDELSCRVKDACEQGVCLEIPDSFEERLRVEKPFQFFIYDNRFAPIGYSNELVKGTGFIKHIRPVGGTGILDVGCLVSADKMEEYLRHFVVFKMYTERRF